MELWHAEKMKINIFPYNWLNRYYTLLLLKLIGERFLLLVKTSSYPKLTKQKLYRTKFIKIFNL